MISQPYSYCFLRYRRDAEVGEFANVGVALWAPASRFLGFAQDAQPSFSDTKTN